MGSMPVQRRLKAVDSRRTRRRARMSWRRPLRKNAERIAAGPGGAFLAHERSAETETSALLTESEIERIREGVRSRVCGPVVLGWLERLLQDRDERVRRDRALAVQLLADAAPRPQPTLGARRRAAELAVAFEEARGAAAP